MLLDSSGPETERHFDSGPDARIGELWKAAYVLSSDTGSEGFDNSDESLTMSAALLDKYLEAARCVANQSLRHITGGSHSTPARTNPASDPLCR